MGEFVRPLGEFVQAMTAVAVKLDRNLFVCQSALHLISRSRTEGILTSVHRKSVTVSISRSTK